MSERLRRTIAEALLMDGHVAIDTERIEGARIVVGIADEVGAPVEYDRDQIARDVHETLHPRWRWDDGTGACGHPACARPTGG